MGVGYYGFFFFCKDTATTEIYTLHIVGSVRCVQETGYQRRVHGVCGGTKDTWIQEREQWHSGANFFALGPGKVMGYARNVYTMEEMSKHGFEIIRAKDVITNHIDLNVHSKYVVTIDGSELPRGGGGARCMTMPVRRKKISWQICLLYTSPSPRDQA
eukprot:TRINITY_DN8814_c0_g1_i2.p1 TRINITY_DN8814_c0_g1~~TRINITY_DN8814_c0_g1_i2.p1  ORF type:complete len:158 (-),score=12.39 TRINITY_DN8814_c0_g1_i2:106-579(-)